MSEQPDLFERATHPALTTPAALDDLLDAWVEAGWLRRIDRAVATFLRRHAPGTPPLAALAAVLASHQGGGGHVCLDLAEVLARPDLTLRLPPADPLRPGPVDVPTPQAVLAGVSLSDWRECLLDHPAVCRRDWNPDDDPTGDGRPLVLVDTPAPQLYLRRYWQVEGDVAAGLARLADPHRNDAIRPEFVRPILDALYPPRAGGESSDWQKLACALAIREAFAVITGGPGTGKTTTVVRLLAALLALDARDDATPPRIALCAPTGKAAARLGESIGDKVGEIARLPDNDFPGGFWARIAERLPVEVRTIHRLIGTRPLAERPRHHRHAPLDIDIVVVDEASMVGLELMAQLVDALPPHARLVLLGDKDQLASVEAGAVLGELCRGAERGDYPAGLAEWLEGASGERIEPGKNGEETGAPADEVANHVAMLRHSHRFGHASAIGRLARAVNAGDAESALAILQTDSPEGEVEWRQTRLDGPSNESALAETVLAGVRPWLAAIRDGAGFDPDSAADRKRLAGIFADHNGFQLLCALRRGPSGVEGLNDRIERWLNGAGLVEACAGGWYAGRPVIVTRNDPQLGLANGDMGLTVPLRGAVAPPTLRVVFPTAPDEDGLPSWRWISPARLGDAETAWALTVHKSQGSEFDQVAMVLPERPNPVLTRELIYTGITRARARFGLFSLEPGTHAPAAADVLRRAVETTTRRSGNLRRRLAQAMRNA